MYTPQTAGERAGRGAVAAAGLGSGLWPGARLRALVRTQCPCPQRSLVSPPSLQPGGTSQCLWLFFSQMFPQALFSVDLSGLSAGRGSVGRGCCRRPACPSSSPSIPWEGLSSAVGLTQTVLGWLSPSLAHKPGPRPCLPEESPPHDDSPWGPGLMLPRERGPSFLCSRRQEDGGGGGHTGCGF